MNKIPEIFSNGSIYFPKDSIFAVCDHHISEGDAEGVITIRLKEGITNIWEVNTRLRPFLTIEQLEGGVVDGKEVDAAVKFLAARNIPGREVSTTANYRRFTVEAPIADLAKLVLGLGGSLEHGIRHEDRIGQGAGPAPTR